MEVRNCKMCRRLFNYLGGPNICPACRDELERKFIAVRDYIKDEPGASLQEVADANEINVQQIREWLREGRLEVAKESPLTPKCEKCGKPIRKGRYCDDCKNNMANTFQALGRDIGKSVAKPADDEKASPKGPKMRFKRME